MLTTARKYFKKVSTFLSILSLILFIGCIREKPDISKCWFYTFETDFKTDSKNGLTPASFLCLQKDGTYTRDFGIFDFGRWTYIGNRLILTSLRNQTSSLEIKSLKTDEMTIGVEGEIMNFEGQVLPSERTSESPFSLENNQWRIPAAQKENEEALRRRLYSHCRFWEKYFTWALNTHQTYIDVRSTPSPIKIYGNGFTLKKIDDEPGRWKTYFHDEEDCKKANEILENIFTKHEIALAHTDNKYKMFIGAFQQLENILK
jgi:hypothetical protein